MTAQDDQTAANEAAAEPTVAGPQSEPAVTSVEAAIVASPYASPPPAVLSDEQRALLVAVLDAVVPPRDGLAGAGGLGVDASIERTLALTPHLRRLFLDGLAEIEQAAARRSARDFSGLDPVTREEVLRAVEEMQPAFFAALVEHTYRGYYILPAVHAAIGYESRPPQPLGYALAPFREELLSLQRGREPFWRRAPS
jgi:hypothetical protein